MKQPLSPGRRRHMLAEASPVAPDVVFLPPKPTVHLILKVEIMKHPDPKAPLLALVTAKDNSADLLFATGPLCARFAEGERVAFFKAELTDGAIEFGERVSGWS